MLRIGREARPVFPFGQASPPRASARSQAYLVRRVPRRLGRAASSLTRGNGKTGQAVRQIWYGRIAEDSRGRRKQKCLRLRKPPASLPGRCEGSIGPRQGQTACHWRESNAGWLLRAAGPGGKVGRIP